MASKIQTLMYLSGYLRDAESKKRKPKGHGPTQDSVWQNYPVFRSVSAANLPLAMFMEKKKKNDNMNMTIEEKEKCGFLKLLVLLFSEMSGLEI